MSRLGSLDVGENRRAAQGIGDPRLARRMGRIYRLAAPHNGL
ncbi:MAG TPA: hypothetical protein VKY38_03095 [Azoarcus sp.]|nr:hypothetical protein [Azoarcus sp.]